MGELVRVIDIPGRGVALTDVSLPTPVPRRVYISGYEYTIAAPRVPLPPIANVIKLVMNWTSTAARKAKNIAFAKIAGGSGSTSDPTFLQAVANNLMTQLVNAAWASQTSTAWTLTSVTAKDAGGTTAQADSSVGGIGGSVSGTCLPPQSAIVLSWQIAESYRGGKPRWYLPGIPQTVMSSSGDSAIQPTYATQYASSANYLLSHFNSTAVSGTTLTLGTVSYHTGHAVRPTPLFRAFLHCKVHERVDSQRRRSGPESAFAVIP